eukprot:gnl/TRDRNA2_/TRDRNA2_177562_c1_seq1.p1 gnl/TRDRNA2_/TRDRNA2_177562_c1~~gnl/TRDRNA2_/TRDRNA2_177562_c1_seq1.p1  ORF type:complete len:322 (+),score=-40.60 gnl/TRDRNA2_/TRDRNA2_177562_c1_seq1:233-1198(+)
MHNIRFSIHETELIDIINDFAKQVTVTKNGCKFELFCSLWESRTLSFIKKKKTHEFKLKNHTLNLFNTVMKQFRKKTPLRVKKYKPWSMNLRNTSSSSVAEKTNCIKTRFIDVNEKHSKIFGLYNTMDLSCPILGPLLSIGPIFFGLTRECLKKTISDDLSPTFIIEGENKQALGRLAGTVFALYKLYFTQTFVKLRIRIYISLECLDTISFIVRYTQTPYLNCDIQWCIQELMDESALVPSIQDRTPFSATITDSRLLVIIKEVSSKFSDKIKGFLFLDELKAAMASYRSLRSYFNSRFSTPILDATDTDLSQVLTRVFV